MIDVIFDCETTGINPMVAEIIEAYFVMTKDNQRYEYHYRSQVDKWSHEAAEIHKIPESKMLTYPKKNESIRRLLSWLPSDFRFVTYVNKNTMFGHVNFDVAILKNELDLLGYGVYYLENHHQMKPSLSVHSILREKIRLGLFDFKGRLSQENVYKELFNESYNAHDAKSDVLALERIYNYINNDKPINKKQMSLI